MKQNLTILIIGGYGTFGGRIVELLENEERLTLVVSGRSLQKAIRYCQTRGKTKARIVPAFFERTHNTQQQLQDIKPDIVIDASGPFQQYGANMYDLVETCIEQKINYLDLADGSLFVDGINAFDAAARAADVFVLSGVSSFPVLTSAVVSHLANDLDQVTAISGGIAPSPYAGVGSNVLRAIAGYAGQKLPLRQAGQDITAYPLTDTRRYTIAPPGHLPLRNILFSLVDVPDLRVLADQWPDATVWMGAGPVPEILHRALNSCAWLVRLGLVKSLIPLAQLMEFAIAHMRWGEHRGGMFVEVQGVQHGIKVAKSWHLLAEGHDGPLIPSMAVEAVIRRLLADKTIPAGARAALKDISLADYERLFSARTIYTGERHEHPDAPLFKAILGAAWEKLPTQIRQMHDFKGQAQASGRARIEHGTNPLGRLARILMRFPSAGNDVPVEVDFSYSNSNERWKRTFNGQSFHSHLRAGHGRSDRLLTERFGIITFAMALVWEDNRLNFVLRRWSILGIPLPMFLCVKTESYEHVDDQGRFNFHVRIWHPLTGLIVLYKGWLLRKA